MRWFKPPASVIDSRNTRFIEINTIPQLARNRPVRLVQCFTVIRVGTSSHRITSTKSHLHEPVRIRERLAGHADDVSLAQP